MDSAFFYSPKLHQLKYTIQWMDNDNWAYAESYRTDLYWKIVRRIMNATSTLRDALVDLPK